MQQLAQNKFLKLPKVFEKYSNDVVALTRLLHFLARKSISLKQQLKIKIEPILDCINTSLFENEKEMVLIISNIKAQLKKEKQKPFDKIGKQMFQQTAEKNKAVYQKWFDNPGNKCNKCWLMKDNCFCSDLPDPKLRHQIVCYIGNREICHHDSSNTGKLLLMWGGVLIVEGVKKDEKRLDQLIAQHKNPVVLFPSENAITGSELIQKTNEPLLIIVLDGSWGEAKRMNKRIDSQVQRVCLAEINALKLRDTLGATRKYDKNVRVQTAPAFVQFIAEMGEDVQNLEQGYILAVQQYASQHPHYIEKMRPKVHSGYRK